MSVLTNPAMNVNGSAAVSLQSLCCRVVRENYHILKGQVPSHLEQVLVLSFFEKHPVPAQLKQFKGLFADLLLDKKDKVEISGDNTLRAQVHQYADLMHLKHESFGESGYDRCVQLSKPDMWRWEFSQFVQPKPAYATSGPRRNERRRHDRERERRDDAQFQIYCKFRAWGYDSPEDMMENEPELAEAAGYDY